jgi:hypothetical protein
MAEDPILLARVDALERTIIELRHEIRGSQARRDVRRRGMTALALALTLTAVVWGHADDNKPLVLGPGGVVVTNEQGKAALTMQAIPGIGGRIAVFNAAGSQVAELIATGDQCCGRLEIFQGGDEQPKVVVGVSGTRGAIRFRSDSEALSQISASGFAIRGASSADPIVAIREDEGGGGLVSLRTAAGAPMLMLSGEEGNGLIRAYGPSGVATVLGSSNGIGMLRLNSTNAQAAMLAQGDGKLSFTNAAGMGVVAVGGNTTGGYFVATNNAGKEAATLSIDGDGFGLAQLWRSGELSLIAGTTQGKGDLCVNGTKGKLCMGMLGVRSMIQY